MSEWKEVVLGEVATIVDCEHKTAPTVDNSDYISVRTSNIALGKIDLENSNRVSKKTYEEWTNRMIPKEGDIILAREAPVGEVGWVPGYGRICLGQRTVLIRVNDDDIIYPKYLLYYMVNRETKQDLISRSTGSVVSHLNVKDIRNFDLKIHKSLPEQRIIASVLSSLDDKIDLLHRQNETLEQMAETLFRQWFVEEEIELRQLGECIDTKSGGTPSRKKIEYYENGEYLWVKSKELNRGYILDTEEKITEDALLNSSAKILPENSILVAMYGATVGQFAILGQAATCNQAICACIPNKEFPYTYIYFLIKSSEEELIGKAVGSAQQNISQVLIKGLEIPVDKKKIDLFHTIVDSTMKRIKSNYLQIHTLEKLRDTLLPKLMSGELRVKLDEQEK